MLPFGMLARPYVGMLPPAAAAGPVGTSILLKLCLSGDQCGALIGKAGSVITFIQRTFSVLIKAGSVGACGARAGGGGGRRARVAPPAAETHTSRSRPLPARRRGVPGHALPRSHRAGLRSGCG